MTKRTGKNQQVDDSFDIGRVAPTVGAVESNPEAREGLLEAMNQLDRGEGISKAELFRRLASHRR